MADPNRLLGNDIPSSLGDALYQTGRNALMYPFRNPEATAEFGLSMAPGSGEAMSARDAWNASGAGGNALLAGNYGEAASNYGNMLLGVAGAVPGLGIIARGTKRGAAWMDRNLPAGVNRLLDGMMPADPKNTTNIFAGPTAKTADHEMLAKAQEMAAAGVNRDAIHAQTGWHQGGDGKWRFEIDDSNVLAREGSGTASTVLPHPELYAAYPEVGTARMRTRFGVGADGAGGENSRDFLNRKMITVADADAGKATSTAIHELQHAVQKQEGWTSGADPAWARDTRTASELGDLRDTLRREYQDKRLSPEEAVRQAAAERALIADTDLQQKGMGAYRRNAGEAEARNAEARLHMSPEQRRQLPPWKTQDIPSDLQIYGDHSVGKRLANSFGITDLREGQYAEALRELRSMFKP